MNMHVSHLTPTQIKSIERSARFKATIEAKAAELAARKMSSALDALRVVALETPLVHRAPAIREIPPEAMPAETDPPSNPNWFAILASDPVQRDYPSILQIQKAVCERYGVKLKDMLSARRTADIVHPRQVACYLCKTLTPFSFPLIGRRFGGRDHTTILHAFQKIGRLSRADEKLAGDIDELTALLTGERQ